MASQYDILVVGAGPAGSSAAWVAARQGLNVLVVERKETIGVPVRCAEYIPKALLGKLPSKYRDFVVQSVSGMKTILPSGTTKETKSPGFTINRSVFDQYLAREAQEAGALVITGTRVVDKEGQSVILKGNDGSFFRVIAQVVIGADGPFSVVRRWMGISKNYLLPAVQINTRLTSKLEFTEVYFAPEIYGGYGWLFPKDDRANVGVGIVRGGQWSPGLKETLEWFIEKLYSEGRIKDRGNGLMAGWIPAAPVYSLVKDNMLLVGDAGGQTHPITGAGITQAVLCGYMAGKWAGMAVREDNLGLLKNYDHEWQEEFWDSLDYAFNKRKVFEQKWHSLEQILPQCWVAFKEYYDEL